MASSAELRRQVESLAVRLVVEGPGSTDEWMASLERIRAVAEREGSAAVAETAERLAAAPPATLDPDSFQQQMALLQQALDSPAGPPRAAEPAPAQDAELIADFVLESREHLATIEAQALALER